MTIISFFVLLLNILEQLVFVTIARTVCDFKSSRLRYVGYFLLILTVLPAPIIMNKPDFCPKEICLILKCVYLFGRIGAYSVLFEEFSKRVLYIFLLSEYTPQIFLNLSKAYIKNYEFCNLAAFSAEVIVLASILIYIKRKKIEIMLRQIVRSLPKRLYVDILLLFFIASIFVMGETKDNHELYYKRYILPSMIGLIVVAISIVKISISEAEKRTTIDMLSKQVENEIKYYEKINTIYGEFRSFRHDFKNHIICLRSLIDAEENDKAVEYIDDIESLSSVEKKQYNTGNIIIDALMNDKNDRAATVNTRVVFSGMVPTTGISNVDLCIIMANAIDNAIEACGKDTSEKPKEINVKADFKQGYFFFNITNPIFETVEIKSNKTIATSKSDKDHHGFGVSNILRVVQKYDGEADLSADDKQFTLDLNLMLKSEEI
ncbi:MAG: GHKL domain-containing protein [Ruminococcus sp.]|nr:GHKL domain-containing protein [Ruminococcus sp.]